MELIHRILYATVLAAVVGCAAVLAASVGCAAVEDGFTEAEKRLIAGEAGDAAGCKEAENPVGNGAVARDSMMFDAEMMRVLQSDVEDDLAVLRMKAAEVSDGMMKTVEFELLCSRMLATVNDPANTGVGIAAPQVGISRRLVAVQRFDKAGEPFGFYVNPEIVRYGDETAPGWEGCLSVPDMRGVVERSQEIELRYRTACGRDTLETVRGFTAVIFQHEIDHLDGLLYFDRAEEMFLL